MTGPRYAELQVTSHFSFLRGASSCEELFAQASLLGIEALAVWDDQYLPHHPDPTRIRARRAW
jgi:error-prone DNA polymerase